MAAVKNRNTRPELLLRSVLHAAGFRYGLRTPLPGKPDLTLSRHRVTVFVHGCFWHKHDCPRFKQPGGENAAFWQNKLTRNVERDAAVSAELASRGWRQLVVWECALIGTGRLENDMLVDRVRRWIGSGQQGGEIIGMFE